MRAYGWIVAHTLKSNELHVLQTDMVSNTHPALTWSSPVTSGSPPSSRYGCPLEFHNLFPRAGHAADALGTSLYIFGGGNGSHYLNDMHCLSVGEISSAAKHDLLKTSRDLNLAAN